MGCQFSNVCRMGLCAAMKFERTCKREESCWVYNRPHYTSSNQYHECLTYCKTSQGVSCPHRLARHAEHRQYLDMWTCSGDLDFHLWCSAPTDKKVNPIYGLFFSPIIFHRRGVLKSHFFLLRVRLAHVKKRTSPPQSQNFLYLRRHIYDHRN